MNAKVVLTCMLVSWFLFVSSDAEAGYNVDVKKKSSFPEAVGTIAVLPPTCPASVDCVWLERKINQLLAKRPDIRVVSTDTVSQVMFDEGVSAIDDATRKLIAQKLSADSFMQIIVGHSGSESSGAYGTVIGNTVIVDESAVSVGGLQVRIFGAQDASTLMNGTGHGKSEFRKPEGVLAKIFAEILAKTFPKK